LFVFFSLGSFKAKPNAQAFEKKIRTAKIATSKKKKQKESKTTKRNKQMNRNLS